MCALLAVVLIVYFMTGKNLLAAAVVFGQHASDAIVWWDRRLIFMRPDWIHEPAPNTNTKL